MRDGQFRNDMRAFVQSISAWAKGVRPGFAIIAQNGEGLVTEGASPSGRPATSYLQALDGLGREGVFCGNPRYNSPTRQADTNAWVQLMNVAKRNGAAIMVTDYCSTPSLVDDAYAKAAAQGYISFVASTGNTQLNAIPTYPARPVNENARDVKTLADAKNLLYLIDPSPFSAKQGFLQALRATNYDLVLIDAFFDDQLLTKDDVASLQKKANGGARLVIAYVNIGSAENYRYYWQPGWKLGSPSFLAKAYQGYPDELYVKYWDPAWQAVMFGTDSSYMKKVLNAGFDGAYLDNVLAYEEFEGNG